MSNLKYFRKSNINNFCFGFHLLKIFYLRMFNSTFIKCMELWILYGLRSLVSSTKNIEAISNSCSRTVTCSRWGWRPICDWTSPFSSFWFKKRNKIILFLTNNQLVSFLEKEVNQWSWGTIRVETILQSIPSLVSFSNNSLLKAAIINFVSLTEVFKIITFALFVADEWQGNQSSKVKQLYRSSKLGYSFCCHIHLLRQRAIAQWV